MSEPQTQLDVLTDLGYEVGMAFAFEDFTTYRVTGFGVDVQVRDDDPEAIQSLIGSHDDRVEQIAEREAAEEAERDG